MLIIKGATYFNGENLLTPHFSGDFHTVDCTEWKTKKQIKNDYDKTLQKEMLSNPTKTYEGIKYYQCEYSPYSTRGMDLLSDISNLSFEEEEHDL